MDISTISKAFVRTMNINDIETHIMKQKMGRRRLNAKCNEKIGKSISSMVTSKDIKSMLNNTTIYGDSYYYDDNSFCSDGNMFKYYKASDRQGNFKNCNMCKIKLLNGNVYCYTSSIIDKTSITTCHNCIISITTFAEEQTIQLGKYEAIKLLLLFRESEIFKSVDIDAFHYIFQLMLILK